MSLPAIATTLDMRRVSDKSVDSGPRKPALRRRATCCVGAPLRCRFVPVCRVRIGNSHRTISPFKPVGKILVAKALARAY